MTSEVALSVRNLSKSFGATVALDRLDADFQGGAVTALLGENGSGKSTLVKILAGVVTPGRGADVRIYGQRLAFPAAPRALHDRGLRVLHQDLGLIPSMTVTENLALGLGHARNVLRASPPRRERRRAEELVAQYGVHVDGNARVMDLSPAEQTMIAIARAFGGGEELGARCLILDEPTAALPDREVARVLSALRAARDAGAAVLLVTHRLDDVLAVADDVTVLRDGRVVAQQKVGDATPRDLVRLMLGRSLDDSIERGRPRRLRSDAPPVLRARGLSGRGLNQLDLDLFPGEVVGLAGLVGSGRSEAARALGGVIQVSGGTLEIDGVPRVFGRPADAVRSGVVSVPRDRLAEGCLPGLSLRHNLTLGELKTVSRHSVVNPTLEVNEVERLIRAFGVRPPRPDRLLGAFSGGNQQKAALARCVRLEPRVLILDEPTQGIDVGARLDIWKMILRLRDEGVAVLVASTDLDELLRLADRVLVIHRGRVSARLDTDGLARQELAVQIALSAEAA